MANGGAVIAGLAAVGLLGYAFTRDANAGQTLDGGIWDANIDPQTKADVKTLLANEKNPAVLRAYAAQLRAAGLPKAAQLLERQADALAAAVPTGGGRPTTTTPATASFDAGMPQALEQAYRRQLTEQTDPAQLRNLASSLLYLGMPFTAQAFLAKANQLQPAGANVPLAQAGPFYDDGLTPDQANAQETQLRQTWSSAQALAIGQAFMGQKLPNMGQRFQLRAMALKAAEPAAYVAPTPQAAVPATLPPIPTTPPPPPGMTTNNTPPLPPGVTPGGTVTIPAIPGVTPGGTVAIPGFTPGTTPAGATPAGTTPASLPKPAPSTYGLPEGGYVEGRKVRHVLQPGEFGQKIAVKYLGKDKTKGDLVWPYVQQLVKANPQVKDWTKAAAGTDLSIPDGWWPLPSAVIDTTRPGPPAPSYDAAAMKKSGTTAAKPAPAKPGTAAKPGTTAAKPAPKPNAQPVAFKPGGGGSGGGGSSASY